MFGSHLSSAGARKASDKNKGTRDSQAGGGTGSNSATASGSAVDSVFSFLDFSKSLEEVSSRRRTWQEFYPEQTSSLTHPHKVLLDKGQVPLKFFGSSPDDNSTFLPKEEMMQFWIACSMMLLSDEGIHRIVTDAAKNNNALHAQAIEFQRDVMEFNFGIERVWGCNQIGKVHMNYPNDTALHMGAGSFMRVAMYSFVEQLKYRQKLANMPLRSTGGLSYTNLMEFFEGCNAAMSLESTQRVLKDAWMRSKDIKEVGKCTITVQHRLLGLLGVTIPHGIEQLNSLQTQYPNDIELSEKFQSFQLTAEMSTRMASMTVQEKKDFLDEVPVYMHAVPHIYFCQKQRMINHQNRQRQENMDAQMANPEVRAQQERMLAYMNTDAGQDKIFGIVKRITDNQQSVEEKVRSWNAAKRVEFFESFSQHDYLGELIEAGPDTLKRIDIVDGFAETDMDSLLTMQAVFAADARDGGALIAKLRQDPSVVGVGTAMQTLGLMHKLSGFEKGAKFEVDNKPRSHDHSHGHDHGHAQEHVHGPNCKHGPVKDKAPDVSTGKADTIER